MSAEGGKGARTDRRGSEGSGRGRPKGRVGHAVSHGIHDSNEMTADVIAAAATACPGAKEGRRVYRRDLRGGGEWPGIPWGRRGKGAVRSQRGGGVERGGRMVAQLDWACRMAWISPFVSQAVYSPVSVMGVSPTTWRDIRDVGLM
jgi:hypothetical protein